jgi:signal-transduction protein with cAMP-binding, CBS, and nucleotidyltransferase domain
LDYSALNTFRFSADTCIPQAQPKERERVLLNSPAISVMTDLAQVRAETISPETPIAKAEEVMKFRGVRSLFVTSNFPCVDGLVTAADLVGNKPLQVVGLRQIKFQDVCVSDVMKEFSDMDLLDYDELKTATVSRVVGTFKKLKCSHILVVQAATKAGPARIRGVISLTQVERQLGEMILAVAS